MVEYWMLIKFLGSFSKGNWQVKIIKMIRNRLMKSKIGYKLFNFQLIGHTRDFGCLFPWILLKWWWMVLPLNLLGSVSYEVDGKSEGIYPSSFGQSQFSIRCSSTPQWWFKTRKLKDLNTLKATSWARTWKVFLLW